MKALTTGRYRGRDGIWAVFDLDFGTELRVGILEGDIGRVVLKREAGYRLDRGWSIAPGGLEPAYEGRARDDLSGSHLPAGGGHRRRGHGSPWQLPQRAGGGRASSRRSRSHGGAPARDARSWEDRRTQAYFLSRKTGRPAAL